MKTKNFQWHEVCYLEFAERETERARNPLLLFAITLGHSISRVQEWQVRLELNVEMNM